jgi:hypothetical protein
VPRTAMGMTGTAPAAAAAKPPRWKGRRPGSVRQGAFGEHGEPGAGAGHLSEVGGVGDALFAVPTFDEHGADPAQDQAGERLAGEDLAGHEPQPAGDDGREDQAVDPAGVVGDDVVRPGHRQRRLSGGEQLLRRANATQRLDA